MRGLNNRGLISVAAAFLLSVTGCSFEHVAGTDDDTMTDTVMVDGELWEVHGYVHAEAWTPAFFYVFPLMPGQDAEEARRMAVEKARAMGAEEITDVRLHVETPHAAALDRRLDRGARQRHRGLADALTPSGSTRREQRGAPGRRAALLALGPAGSAQPIARSTKSTKRPGSRPRIATTSTVTVDATARNRSPRAGAPASSSAGSTHISMSSFR